MTHNCQEAHLIMLKRVVIYTSVCKREETKLISLIGASLVG